MAVTKLLMAAAAAALISLTACGTNPTNAQIGTIPSTYAIFYAIGQIINGVGADAKFHPVNRHGAKTSALWVRR